MSDSAAKRRGPRRRSLSSPSMLIAGTALFISLGGSAAAAQQLIRSADIAPNAVTSAKIKDGSVTLADLQPKTVTSLHGGAGTNGINGANGPTGAAGTNGLGGTNGANGAPGAAGTNGPGGTNGANGAIGPDGADGADGADGSDGTNGTDGTDGADGVLGPLSATAGLTQLPTATPPTTVVSLTVPAGSYVVFAKTQLTHSGAGDSVTCQLKAGATTIDESAIKTLPALAAVPVTLQAVTTTSPTQLSLLCDVTTANGSADFTSLIALPVS
jgi:hypothetical protein